VNDARQFLLSFNGIGNKIADCILIFSLGFYEITPIDIWAQRILTEYYNLDEGLKYEKMRNYFSQYFKENTAWAGQFLFEYIRNN
jgi:N-glycosylase/DNA lyase